MKKQPVKRIVVTFLGALGGTLLYWGGLQLWDTGALDIPGLLLAPDPWIVAGACTAILTLWNLLFRRDGPSTAEG
ncbi:hypothetical protein [Fodinibius sediminis]|uniref:Uncharacterized protein n=1 Tax=Fodinibius sediminis TaxID=1214077 RepID=A0A521BYA7_9BACT|nr:hypothetical protein [Fodinibius sediminis]SMO51470.1 hypothetical protein SAMN06265218_104102 [Fodinibius sediminis]